MLNNEERIKRRARIEKEQKIVRAIAGAAELLNKHSHLTNLPKQIERINSEITRLKLSRNHAVQEQKDRYKRAVRDVTFLVSEFEKLAELSKTVELKCQATTFNQLDSVERIAFAQENLSSTVQEIDRYRRIPKIVSKLVHDLKETPVQTLPLAHHEYRSMVSWIHHSTAEWDRARQDQLLNGRTNKNYTNMTRMVEQNERQCESVIGLMKSDTKKLNELWRQITFDIVKRCFELAEKNPNYLVLVADIIETSDRQNRMVQSLQERLERIKGEDHWEAGAEIIKRSLPLGIHSSYRKKCIEQITEAAYIRFTSQFQYGIYQYLKEQEEEDAVPKEDLERIKSGNAYEFNELLAGLMYVSNSIIKDVNRVCICFPPWYNIFDIIINAYISSIQELLYTHIIIHLSPELSPEDEWKKEAGEKARQGNAIHKSNETKTSNSSAVSNPIKSETPVSPPFQLSNACLLQLVDWLRTSASNWETDAKKRRIEFNESTDPLNGCTMLLKFASKFVSIYMKRVEKNVIQWTNTAAKKIPTNTDVIFINDQIPKTTAPRDLCRLLDDQYKIVLQQSSLQANEFITCAGTFMQLVGYFWGNIRCNPSHMYWLKNYDIENLLIILCAMIHDNEFLVSWIGDFEDSLSYSDWLASSIDLERSTTYNESSDSDSDSDNYRSRTSSQISQISSHAISPTTTLSDQMLTLEETQSTQVSILLRGQQFYADAISIAIFSTLNNGAPCQSTIDYIEQFEWRIDYSPLKLFPPSNRRALNAISSSSSDESILKGLFTIPWMNNETYTAETICKTLLDFLKTEDDNEYELNTVFSMLGKSKLKMISRIVDNLLKLTGEEYMSKFLSMAKMNSTFLSGYKFGDVTKGILSNLGNTNPKQEEDLVTKAAPAAIQLEKDCDQLLKCFNSIKTHLPSSVFLNKWNYPINVEEEFGSFDNSDEICGRIFLLAQLFNIHQYVLDPDDPTNDDLFQLIQQVETVHKDLNGLQLIKVALQITTRLTVKQKKQALKTAEVYFQKESVFDRAERKRAELRKELSTTM